MNDQELFDHVVLSLRKQGRPSVKINSDGEYKCVYRSEDGSKCAAGHGIPDDIYTEEMDGGYGWADLCNEFSSIRDLGYDEDLMCSLQDAHDATLSEETSSFEVFQIRKDPALWLKSFLNDCKNIAEGYNLDPSCIDAPL